MRRLGALPSILLAVALVWLAGCDDTETGPPGPDIRGVVTSLARQGQGSAVGTLRVEGPRMDDTRYAKALITVTPETKVFQRLPAGKGPVPFSEVRLGDKVEVRFTGPVAQSYPVQATAGEILIVVHLAPPQPPPPAPTPEPFPAQFPGTRQPLAKPPPDRLALPLHAIRTGPQDHFDRAVFEFDGDTVPGYRVEYVDHPVHCGSSLPAEVGGHVWLQVKMSPASNHTVQGGATAGALRRRTRLKAIVELEETCDLEGELTWVLGLDERRSYRAFDLAHPPRIVVDVTR
jgi:hypothetical protein